VDLGDSSHRVSFPEQLKQSTSFCSTRIKSLNLALALARGWRVLGSVCVEIVSDCHLCILLSLGSRCPSRSVAGRTFELDVGSEGLDYSSVSVLACVGTAIFLEEHSRRNLLGN
jgi:hypothetical protein